MLFLPCVRMHKGVKQLVLSFCQSVCQSVRGKMWNLNMWPAERKPGTSRKYWIRVTGSFICTGHFPGKLRLLHQGVTGGLHCTIMDYEARLCYYKDAISLNSQAGQWNTGMHCYGQLKHAFAKRQFHKLPVCYGCFSVYRHNVSPRFYHCCLFQLSLPSF